MGRGHIYDTDEALKVYYVNALALIKGLCDIGDKADMPDLLKRDFKKARENAEKKFSLLRQAHEKEEAEAREEQERKEQAERQHELEREDSHSDNRLTIAFLTIQKLYEQVGINNAKAERALAANRLSEAELYLNSNNQLFKELKARIKMIEDAASNGNADAIALVNSQKWKDIVGRR